jgi:hypothetical protein
MKMAALCRKRMGATLNAQRTCIEPPPHTHTHSIKLVQCALLGIDSSTV